MLLIEENFYELEQEQSEKKWLHAASQFLKCKNEERVKEDYQRKLDVYRMPFA